MTMRRRAMLTETVLIMDGGAVVPVRVLVLDTPGEGGKEEATK